MNNPQHALDTTLDHLRAAPIPEGLEDRLLAALAACGASTAAAHTVSPQASIAAPPVRQRRRFAWPPLRPALLSAGLLAAVALIPLALHLHHRPTPPITPVNTGIYAAQPSTPSPQHPSAPRIAIARAQAVHHSLLPSPQLTADASLALAESNAPSQLAPDLPLTADERALQHLAQHPTPDALDALNPAHNATEELAEQTAFEKFFTPPAVPEAVLKGERN